jgi:hypothetical protein
MDKAGDRIYGDSAGLEKSRDMASSNSKSGYLPKNSSNPAKIKVELTQK